MKDTKAFKVIQPRKDGSVMLTQKWLKENLDLNEGEILIQTFEQDGVLLRKFNPMQGLTQKSTDEDGEE